MINCNLDAVVHHFRFIRDYHKKVKKVDVITEGQLEEANLWIGS
jgi:hypothetical protein